MKRYKHGLSNYQLTTCKMGQLIPVGLLEVLPGDTVQQSTSALIRVAPMVTPTMHPVQVRFHHFYVPNRIILDTWEDFITGGPQNDDPITLPTQTSSATPKTLSDHLGVPPVDGLQYSLLPTYAFNKIYNEYYRDQDLQAERSQNDNSIPLIAWGKDRFTGARPWPQKGPAITIPITGNAPVISTNQGGPTFKFQGGESDIGLKSENSGNQDTAKWSTSVLDFDNNAEWDRTDLEADLSNLDAVDIRDFRKAFALQRYSEARARYGSRYTEYLRYIGVRSSDARLQRPEFLGGGKSTIAFSEVLNTTSSIDAEPTLDDLGHMAGHGIVGVKSNKYRRFFEEHGFVISLMSIRPKIIYANGLDKKFSRVVKEDYYQAELAQIGQQEVFENEIRADADTGNTIFGYTDRYSEYKGQESRVSSEFRDTINYWHLAREFATAPVLNEAFIQCNPSDRIFADQTGTDQFWCMINHKITARRMVPTSPASRII